MTLTKKKMVREIGRRTRLTNREVQEVVETLVDVWTEALVEGEKIEIQNFIVLEVKIIDRGDNYKSLTPKKLSSRHIKRVVLRVSKHIKSKLSDPRKSIRDFN